MMGCVTFHIVKSFTQHSPGFMLSGQRLAGLNRRYRRPGLSTLSILPGMPALSVELMFVCPDLFIL